MQQVMNQFPQTDGTGLLNISGGLRSLEQWYFKTGN
jgi:hypothetical protein